MHSHRDQPKIFLAWLGNRAFSKQLSTTATQLLANRFGVDASAADWQRFGRLPVHQSETAEVAECAFLPGPQRERSSRTLTRSSPVKTASPTVCKDPTSVRLRTSGVCTSKTRKTRRANHRAKVTTVPHVCGTKPFRVAARATRLGHHRIRIFRVPSASCDEQT